MTIKITKKQMKDLKHYYNYVINEKEIAKFNISYVGNNYYYANSLGCRVRVQEYYTENEFGIINKILYIKQDYEGIFEE